MSVTREEVIKGLNDIHAVACGLGDDECYLNSIGIKQLQTLINGATALLKAQEPDETRLVRHYSRPNVYADLWLHCEKCDGRVDDRYKPKFCPECGRPVKWE